MSYSKRITISPRHRALLGFGDGPVTSPTQVDIPVADPTESVIVGEVSPKRVACEDLPADSPWRRPGQVCSAPGPNMIDQLVAWLTPSARPVATATSVATPLAEESMLPTLALLALAGGGAYYLYKSKKKRSA
jgi:hypothetical protein